MITEPSATLTRRRESVPEAAQTGSETRGVNKLVLWLLIVGILHGLVMLGIEVNRSFSSRQEIARLSGDVAALEQQIGQLEAVLAHSNDVSYREQLARQQGFVYPDELRYVTTPRP